MLTEQQLADIAKAKILIREAVKLLEPSLGVIGYNADLKLVEAMVELDNLERL